MKIKRAYEVEGGKVEVIEVVTKRGHEFEIFLDFEMHETTIFDKQRMLIIDEFYGAYRVNALRALSDIIKNGVLQY
jgi:hypothetical protein